MCVFNTTVSFFLSRTRAHFVLSNILLSYLLNIFWRICASCHSPLIRFLICERHVVKFFCSVWLMFFCCYCFFWSAYSLPSLILLLLHIIIMHTKQKRGKFFVLLTHIFNMMIAQGHSYRFRSLSHSLTHYYVTQISV